MSVSFSVIIPTYNRAHMISRTVESVLKQTYPASEIIIVDDASTDNTKSILQKYIDSGKIKYICHERNMERAKARNTGMDNATSNFITFLDSDDIIHENNLGDAKDYIAQNPDAHFIYNFHQLIDEANNVVWRPRYPNKSMANQKLLTGNLMAAEGVFLSREIYKKYRFEEDSDLIGSEDWELWLRISASYKLHTIKKYNNSLIDHPSRSVHTFKTEKNIKRIHAVLNSLLSHAESREYFMNKKNIILAYGYYYCAIMARLSRNHSTALKLLREARGFLPRIIFDPNYIYTFARTFLRI